MTNIILLKIGVFMIYDTHSLYEFRQKKIS
jgi:hypothetical protein